jgi:prefoldin subunit 5
MAELQQLERLVARLRNELQAVREERDELLKTLRSWLRTAKKNMDLDA